MEEKLARWLANQWLGLMCMASGYPLLNANENVDVEELWV